MPGNGQVAYDPSDPLQQQFLSSLALGESGHAANSTWLGVGGHDLTGSAVDSYGFPIWGGVGNSHAAGTYQFQPGTWGAVAKEYGLNFGNPADQNAGAWYLAEQTYSQNTGGRSLEEALSSGDYGSVQKALANVWPSVTGNQAAPQGLAHDIAAGAGAAIGGGSPSSGAGSSGGKGGIIASIENWFQRGGLIIIGVLVALAALWALLSKQNLVPSPAELAAAV